MKRVKKNVVHSLKNHKVLLLAVCLCILAAAALLAVNLVSITIPASAKGPLFSDSQPADTVPGKFTEDERAPEGMKLVTENDGLAIFVNEATSEMAVLDKASQAWWYSNPPDAENDSSGSPSVIGRLRSVLQLKYYNMDDIAGVLYSYGDCIENETIGYEFIENGIRMIFEIGKAKVTREMLPAVVRKDKFESEILSKISEDEKQLIEEYYALEKLSEIKSTVVSNTYSELYTDIDRDEEYYFLDLYTPDYKLEPIYNALYVAAGYTVEDIEADNEEVGYQIEVDSFIRFTVPVEYTLSENSLNVSIPASEITIPAGYKLTEIAFMPYFGCAGLDEEGYLFVPDGSGALINFNNNAKMIYPYNLPVYGEDDGIERSEASFSSARANIPVFGIVYEDAKAMLAVIEEGESHAVIEAGVSGDDGDQNWVGACFELTPMTIETFTDKKISVETNMYQERPYGGRISIKYLFTGAEKSDYSGLACIYREYLQEKGVLTKQKSAAGLHVKMISRLTKETSFLGIPYETEQTVTSFSQAGEIVDQLKKAGVTDMNIGMLSWFGGGIWHDPVTGEVNIASSMGGEKELRKLLSELEGYGELALGADLLKVYEGWPHFNQFKNSSRFLNNSLAVGYSFNPATLRASERRKSFYYLSPRYAECVFDDYAASVNKYGVSGLWLTDAGMVLGSDFSASSAIDRESAKELIINAVAGVAGENRITAHNPNQYLWRYVDAIVDLPLYSSENTIIDESVPFLQMVLSGSIQYTSEAFNRSGNMDGYFLKAVETGGDIYYEWIYETDAAVSQLRGVDTEEVYSMSYENWIGLAVEQYARMKDELSCVEGKEITHHSMLESGVSSTQYGDISVIVNYNEYDVTVDGETVHARDFRVLR